jgi:hypothetical protein
MPTECSRDLFGFEAVEGRQVVAAFDGGQVTSDAGALLLGAANRVIGLVGRLARCFTDGRCQELVEHGVGTMLMQRICGIALGYEDLVDHDELRHDPVLATLAGKLEARRKDCAPLAGKSTLNRLEHAPTSALDRYHKIGHDAAAIEALFVALFLDAQPTAPKEIVLDLDATDDPLHGHQEGRFFHSYYDGYCYLPLYVFCGRHLLAARLRRSNIDASAGAKDEVERIVGQIRKRWPKVKILLRADSGFARDELMAWCEANGVDYVFGLARNARLLAEIEDPLAEAEAEHGATGRPARRFDDFTYATLDSWSRERRVVGKAEHLAKGANPRFIVTLYQSPRSTPGPSTRTSTAPVGTWRTGSKSSSWTCSPIAHRRPPCAPTSSGCGWPPSPTSCSKRCAASACATPSSPPPPAARSASSS